jgi:hypothetical protein
MMTTKMKTMMTLPMSQKHPRLHCRHLHPMRMTLPMIQEDLHLHRRHHHPTMMTLPMIHRRHLHPRTKTKILLAKTIRMMQATTTVR